LLLSGFRKLSLYSKDVIARQRDALSGKSRSKAAKANAMDRKARGIEPGFKKG